MQTSKAWKQPTKAIRRAKEEKGLLGSATKSRSKMVCPKGYLPRGSYLSLLSIYSQHLVKIGQVMKECSWLERAKEETTMKWGSTP